MLLRDLDDTTLLRRLRIHADLGGKLVGIETNSKTYLDGGFPLDRASFPDVTIIARCDDPDLVRKQEQLIPVLDAPRVIAIALGHQQPSGHWQLILDALGKLANSGASMDADLDDRLKGTEWLPLEAGGAVKPDDVISLPGLDDEVARVISLSPGWFHDVHALQKAVRTHAHFDTIVTPLFPDQEDALAMLGELMGRCEEYAVGPLHTGTFDLEAFLDAFRDAPRQLLPCLPLVQDVAQTCSHEECLVLLNQLFLPISSHRIADVLKYLAAAHARAGKKADALLTVHNWYLKLAVELNDQDVRTILADAKLLSRAGNWKPTSRLCLAYEGAADDDLLDEKQGEIIRGKVSSAHNLPVAGTGIAQPGPLRTQADWEQEFERSATLLRDYFQEWKGHVADELIGAFLAVLGDHPCIRELAASYLGNRSVEGTRALFDQNDDVTAGARVTLGAAMRQQRFVIDMIRGATVAIPNLIGTTFDAHRGVHARYLLEGALGDSLFRGREETPDRHQVKRVRLQPVDARGSSEDALTRLLRDTTALVLRDVYCQRPDQSLDAVWKELARSEQLDIQVAETLLLDDAFFYLRQLGVRSNRQIEQVLRQWDQARRREAEEGQAIGLGRTSRERRAMADLEKARADLKELLQNDATAHSVVLDAVGRLMRDRYQYTPESVPFELFQNADDAVVELGEMVGSDTPPNPTSSRFTVIEDSDKYVFIHWGRRINQFASQDFDGRERGFDRDLEKMLVMSASDKQPTDDRASTVTGRFGLGFKSVFLLTDAPRIASGRLSFKVVGAFLPSRLAYEEATDLRAHCASLDPRLHDAQIRDATVIELPLRADAVPADDGAFRRFKELAPLLVGFARRIRHIDFSRGHQITETVSWVEQQVPGVPGAFTADLRTLGEAADGMTRGLMLRTDAGALLLGLGPRTVTKLPRHVPTIWVTAPTREEADLEFAVNAAFPVDVGRAQLARESARNEETARRLGANLGRVLGDLARLPWERLRDALQLAADSDRYSFWESLWNILGPSLQRKIEARRGDEAIVVVKQLLWDEQHGAATELFAKCAVLPTGLAGKHRVVTRLQGVQRIATGVLDADDDDALFDRVSQWPQAKRRIAVGSIVSDKRVFDPLRKLCPNLQLPTVARLSLCDILEWELGPNRRANPDLAQVIGSVVTPAFLERLRQGTVEQRDEHVRLAQFLRQIQLRARDGDYAPASDLLIPRADEDHQQDEADEHQVAAFAPPNFVLDDSYDGAALEFVRACRGGTAFWTNRIVDWVLQADGEPPKLAALRYLAKGQFFWAMGRALQEQRSGTWLEHIQDSPLLRQLDPTESRTVLNILAPRQQQGSDDLIVWPPTPSATRPSVSPRTVLEKVHDWWQAEGEGYIRDYEEQLYVDATCPQVRGDVADLREDPSHRQQWLSLFYYGMTHTMGRTQPGQHRGFLRLCQKRGWLTAFASPFRSPERLGRILDDYLDELTDRAEYYEWIKRLVGIYQIGNWLKEYVEVFLSIDRMRADFGLGTILAPRASDAFQGGGPDAPPLTPVLGLGACYVVRELVRKGVLRNPLAHPHCYVPTRRVRKLITALNASILDGNSTRYDQSRAIHSFLCEHLGEDAATFGRSFDLPLLTIAADPDLQRCFLGHELGEDAGNEDEEEV